MDVREDQPHHFSKRKTIVHSGWGHLFFTLIILVLFQLFPAFADLVYRGFIYPVFRIVWDHTVALLPFPVIYLILIGIPIAIAHAVYKARNSGRSVLIMLTGLPAKWVAAFFWLWGFNYWCSDLETYNPREWTANEYYQWGLRQIEITSAARDASDELVQFRPDQIDEVRDAVERVLDSRDWKTPGKPRIRVLDDNGLIRRLGISGIYFPYSGEGYTSNTFHPLALHFILAHEFAHTYGIAHEGEADFVAWLALRDDATAAFRYSAELQLLRMLRGRLKVENDSLWRELEKQLPEAISDDIRMLRFDWMRYPEFRQGAGEKMNDRYLKIMGQPEGTGSYDQFIEMAWKELEATQPERLVPLPKPAPKPIIPVSKKRTA